MKKHFLKKWVAMLGTISLLANVMLPWMQAFADGPECNDDSIACIGDVWYVSLRAAVSAAESGATILLKNDDEVSFSTENPTLFIDKNLIINWGGNVVKGVNDLWTFNECDNASGWPYADGKVWHWLKIGKNANVTISNLTLTEFGWAYYVNRCIVPIMEVSDYEGMLKLDNVTISKYNRNPIRINWWEFEISNSSMEWNPSSNKNPWEMLCGPSSNQMCLQFQQGIEIKDGSWTITNTDISWISHNGGDWDYPAYSLVLWGGSNVKVEWGSIVTNNWDHSAWIYATATSILKLNTTVQWNWSDENDLWAGWAIEVDTNADISVSGWDYNWSLFRGDSSVISISWWEFSADPTAYLAVGYTATLEGGKYVVKTQQEAFSEDSNPDNTSLAADWTEVSVDWEILTPTSIDGTTIKLNSAEASVTKVDESVATPTANQVKDSDLASSSAYTVTIQWWLDAYISNWSTNYDDKTAVFNKPVALRIPVNTASDVIVKVKHAWDTNFWTVWLTLDPEASCTNWVADPAYTGTPFSVTTVWTNHFAVIYTCQASKFVAYTEAQKQSWSGGGGSSGSSSSSSSSSEYNWFISSHKTKSERYDSEFKFRIRYINKNWA